MKLLKLLLLPYMAAVIAGAFLWVEPAEGFLGESSRIVFFHVPCAWTAALAFLVAAAYSLAYLLARNPRFDEIAHAAVRLGLLFASLTLVTGSLRAAVDDPERRARIAAAYALFAMVLMPFLVFVAPRVTESLHPQTVINPQGKILMDVPTKTVFFAGLAGFTGIFLWLLQLETRLAHAERR